MSKVIMKKEINTINPTDYTDSYGNKWYDVKFSDGMMAKASFKNSPWVKAGEFREFEAEERTTKKGDKYWRITFVRDEEQKQSETKSSSSDNSGWHPNWIDIAHRLNSVALQCSTSLAVEAGKNKDVAWVSETYEKFRATLLTNAMADSKKLAE